MRFSPRPVACLAALLLVACDGGADKTDATGATSPSVATPPEEPPALVTHILIGWKGADRRIKTERTPDEALALAKSIIADIQAGRDFEALLEKFTDDRDKDGKPNIGEEKKPGHYKVRRTNSGMDPEFAKAALETPVGKIAPAPVKSAFGYHIIRRDK